MRTEFFSLEAPEGIESYPADGMDSIVGRLRVGDIVIHYDSMQGVPRAGATPTTVIVNGGPATLWRLRQGEVFHLELNQATPPPNRPEVVDGRRVYYAAQALYVYARGRGDADEAVARRIVLSIDRGPSFESYPEARPSRATRGRRAMLRAHGLPVELARADVERAADDLLASCDLMPDDEDVHYWAWVAVEGLQRVGRHDRVVAVASRVRERWMAASRGRPTATDLEQLLLAEGTSLLALGERERGVERLRAAFTALGEQVSAGYGDVRLQLAEAEYALGQLDQARASIVRVEGRTSTPELALRAQNLQRALGIPRSVDPRAR